MATFTDNKTKTWKGRHSAKLERLATQIRDWSEYYQKPRVLLIGPGGIAQSYSGKFPEGPEETMSQWNRKKLQLLSAAEARPRDNPRVDLVTYEPLEVVNMLNELGGYSSLLVVDSNLRVLKATEKIIEENGLERVDIKQHDIESTRLTIHGSPYAADIVIAYKVLDYAERYNAMLANMLRATREGGLLGLTVPNGQDNPPYNCTSLSRNVYLHGSRPEKRKFEGEKRYGLPSDEEIFRNLHRG